MPSNILNKAEFVDFRKNKEGNIEGIVFKDRLTSKEY